MNLYIFGYGSLMNPKSLAKTLPGKRFFTFGTLSKYKRKINVLINDYLYLNLVKSNDSKVEGVLISITKKELLKLQKREVGYECVDVSSKLKPKIDGKVFTFIAPDKSYPGFKIPKSYLLTCTANMTRKKKEQWLKETIIENGIEDDIANPVYINATFK